MAGTASLVRELPARSEHGWLWGSVAAAASFVHCTHISSLTSSRSAAPVRPPLIPAHGTASPGAEGT